MLTFFRRIRKGLLEGGATSKYLLYAIGEIALVVIGILIALQINNWNEWRKDRVKEKEILLELAQNIEANINFIQISKNRNEQSIGSYHTILNVIDQGTPWNDTLGVHFRMALSSRVPTFSFSAYESLSNKGVDLILNPNLQKEISALYENYNNTNTVITRIVNTELKPNTSDFTIDYFEPFRNNLTNPHFPAGISAFFPNDYQALKTNQKFINLLKFVYTYRIGLFQSHETRCMEESQRVHQLIKDELGESE